MTLACVKETMKFLDETICKLLTADEQITLIEDGQDGEVILKLEVNKNTVVITKADDKIFPYIKKEKLLQKCCDKILFTLNDDKGDCTLHVMEFTRTINPSKLVDKIRPQFKMGIMNAKALAGFFDLNITTIKTYVAYRSVKSFKSALEKRVMNNRYTALAMHDWENEKISLDMPWGSTVYQNVQVQLDENGNGSLVI